MVLTFTVWPSNVKPSATSAVTGPTSSLPNRMSFALPWRPESSELVAPPCTSTTMPSLSSLRLRDSPLSSSSLDTLADESSKRTPLTMMEPKPWIGPEAKEVVLVVPLSPPPPQPARMAAMQASLKTVRTGRVAM